MSLAEDIRSLVSSYKARGDYGVAMVVDQPSFWKRARFAFGFLFMGKFAFILAWRKPVSEYPDVFCEGGETKIFFDWTPETASSPALPPKSVWDYRRENL